MNSKGQTLVWRGVVMNRIASPSAVVGLTSIFFGFGSAPVMAVPSSLCDAVAGNIVTNCGFETGDLTGWTLSGNS
jgi:hypothetical protein